jgi:hypothetical protein
MEKKTIPHEHFCTVCKRPEACEEIFCKRDLWDVCGRPACLEVHANATVHIFTETDTLPCCGKLRTATPGDRMTTDPSKVTCGFEHFEPEDAPAPEGWRKEQRAKSEEPRPASLFPLPSLEDAAREPVTPGHVLGCLCWKCEPPRDADDRAPA